MIFRKAKFIVFGCLVALLPSLFFPAVPADSITVLVDSLNVPADTVGWFKQWDTNLTLAQTSFDNWTQDGGTNQFNVNWYNHMRFLRITEQIRWRTTNFYTLEYARIGSQDFRKTDDRLQLESIFSWNVPWQIDPYIGFSAVTQLLPGYNYAENNTAVRTSGIFDPGYLNQSVGFVHYLNSILVSRVGFAVRETFARKYARHILPDSLKSYDIQYGIEIVSDYNQHFGEWLNISSQVNIFSPLVSFRTTDVRWINYIAFQFLSYLTVQFQWTLIYDINQSHSRQLRDILTFGFHYTVF